MSTFHSRAADSHLLSLLGSDPATGAIVATTKARLSVGGFKPWQDIVYQPWREYSLSQSLVFAEVWHLLTTGGVAHAPISAADCDGPSSDKLERENNAKLKTLTDGTPFTAKFIPEVGSGANSDGYMSWDEPITLCANGAEVTFGAGSVPLEVGTTEASRTMMHLRNSGGVARWPYGSSHIWLLLITNEERDRYMNYLDGLLSVRGVGQ